jgi:hypothetical protein
MSDRRVEQSGDQEDDGNQERIDHRGTLIGSKEAVRALIFLTPFVALAGLGLVQPRVERPTS